VRRCLHAFLVGLLTVSTTMDAARACWYLRRGCRVAPPTVVCSPAMAVESEGCGDATIGDGCETVAGDVCGSSGSGDALHIGGHMGEVVVVGDVVTADAIIVTEPTAPSVAAEAPSPTVTEPLAPPQPTLAEAPVTSLAAVVPELRPAEPTPGEDVQQTAAVGDATPRPEAPAVAETVADPAPVTEPEPSPEEAPPMPQPVVLPTPEPVDDNIFEEVDRAAEIPADAAAAAEPAVTTSEDEVGAPADVTDAPGVADAPPAAVAEPVPGTEEPAAIEPAPAVESEEPSIPSRDAAARESREPARRWIDHSGGYAVVGTLVAVRADGTCVIAAPSRTIEVRLEALSAFDRDYVATAAERLARAAGPEAADTVGL
jgi:hypothetical protein